MEVATGRGCKEGRRMRGSEVVVAGKCFLASSCLEVFVHCVQTIEETGATFKHSKQTTHTQRGYITTVPIVRPPTLLPWDRENSPALTGG